MTELMRVSQSVCTAMFLTCSQARFATSSATMHCEHRTLPCLHFCLTTCRHHHCNRRDNQGTCSQHNSHGDAVRRLMDYLLSTLNHFGSGLDGKFESHALQCK